MGGYAERGIEARLGKARRGGRAVGLRRYGYGKRSSLTSAMRPSTLPLFELESAVVSALRAGGRLIVQAPTGSG